MSRLTAKAIQEILETFSEVEDGKNLKTRSFEKKSNLRSFSITKSLETTNRKTLTPRTPPRTKNLKKYFSEYCDTSGIHGVRYLGESGRFLIEKLTWCAVVVTMCYCCIVLILSAYNKWDTSPVIVSFATTETSIWEIPFPAVTFCPVVKSDPEIFNFTDVYLKLVFKQNITAEESRYFESQSLVCTNVGVGGSDTSVTVNESAVYDLNLASPDNYLVASWVGNESGYLVSGIYTREGYCYNFNMLDIDEILFHNADYIANRSIKGRKAKKWSIENGYSTQDEMDTFPRRTFVNGINGGFDVQLLTNHSHLDYICAGSLQGFKVVLHHPSELPDMNQHFQIPLDQAVSVTIIPKMITASEEVKLYEPKKRGCFFPNERRLMFFRSYSQRNCLDECLANYTFKECGCVAFYMPKIPKTPICGPGSKRCLAKCDVKYLLSQTERNASSRDCNCLPSCMSLSYGVEISQNDFNFREVLAVYSALKATPDSLSAELEKVHSSKLSVYFREMQFMSSQRHEQYGSVEFFSNSGGLLGLFLGFSVTSAIEIVYYLTLRIVCNIKKYGRSSWAGEGKHWENAET